MYHEFKIFGLKVLCLLIVAPIFASALLQILDKIEKAWKENDRKKKFWSLTMLMIFVGVILGWLQ
jgi:hypothetical protein